MILLIFGIVLWYLSGGVVITSIKWIIHRIRKPNEPFYMNNWQYGKYKYHDPSGFYKEYPARRDRKGNVYFFKGLSWKGVSQENEQYFKPHK